MSDANVPAIPEYMKKFMAQNQQDTTAMVASSISIPRLSIKGKVFRFIKDGEETKAGSVTNVIVLGVEPEAGRFIKTYYEKEYQSGDSDPPTCSSSDGVRPDSWVNDPQCDYCSKCPKNVFGSATSKMTGKKTKACKDGKRLWVARPEAPEEYYGLNVPIMSMKPMSEYGKFIAKNGYPLALVLTELSFDDDSEFPKVLFKHVGFVDEKHVETVTNLNTERPWGVNFANVPMLPDGQDGGGSRPQLPGKGGTAPAPTDSDAPPAAIDDVVGAWGE